NRSSHSPTTRFTPSAVKVPESMSTSSRSASTYSSNLACILPASSGASMAAGYRGVSNGGVGMERPDRVADDPWWRFGLVTVGVLFRAGIRLRVVGVDRIPPAGPAILAANHVSPLDPIAVALAAARRGRTIRYLTASEAYDIPVIGWGLRRFRQIPIRRGARDRAAVEDAASVIRNGALAGIFPEGRLGPGDALL